MTKGLYIHIPFCAKKCNYCNFYSHICSSSVRTDYIDSLCREIKKWGTRTACPIDTIYFGGGTPSLLSADELERIMNAIKSSFHITENTETTCEVNPDDCEFLYSAIKAGFNRISIGIQSSNDRELESLGRRHSFGDARNTVLLARKLGIQNISVDIMLGLPNSTLKTLEKSLNDIISLNTEHISAYILKVEENTPFDKMNICLPDEDEVSNQYLFLCDTLKSAGYEHYEISNFAKNGYQSRHNNKYWECEEYIGIGPSAHSFFEGKRFYYPNDISAFIKGFEPVFDSFGGDRQEYIMLTLRLSKGLNFKDYFERFKEEIPKTVFQKAELLSKTGLVNLTDKTISLTDRGMLLSNSIITELIKNFT